MVRKHTHRTGRLLCLVTATVAVLSATPLLNNYVSADENVTFEVNIKEALTVSVTTPKAGEWASGNANDFLRNTVNLAVDSNDTTGFTVSMTSASTTTGAPLTNTAATSSSTISTLAANTSWTRSNTTTTKFWGYSVDDDNQTGTYYPVPLKTGTPVTLTPANTSGNWSDDIYFGAKADYTADSGTYRGTVIINVVTGAINTDTNPTVPTNPATPSDDPANDGEATYTGVGTTTGTGTSGSNGTTIYTTTSSTTATTTTRTEVTEGDVRDSYTAPAGVAKISEGTPLATGLAATSAVAAATGIVFFIIAKRRKDEEDEEEY